MLPSISVLTSVDLVSVFSSLLRYSCLVSIPSDYVNTGGSLTIVRCPYCEDGQQEKQQGHYLSKANLAMREAPVRSSWDNGIDIDIPNDTIRKAEEYSRHGGEK